MLDISLNIKIFSVLNKARASETGMSIEQLIAVKRTLSVHQVRRGSLTPIDLDISLCLQRIPIAELDCAQFTRNSLYEYCTIVICKSRNCFTHYDDFFFTIYDNNILEHCSCKISYRDIVHRLKIIRWYMQFVESVGVQNRFDVRKFKK